MAKGLIKSTVAGTAHFYSIEGVSVHVFTLSPCLPVPITGISLSVDFSVVEIDAHVLLIISAIILDGIIRLISGPGSDPGVIVFKPPGSS
jgi:hypothetical protein